MIRPGESAKLFAAAIFGGVVVISGAAAAATGSLPLVQSGHHSSHAPKVHTPDANDDQGDSQGDDTEDTTTATNGAPDSTGPSAASTTPDSGKGSQISQLAHSLPQGHKGQTICVTGWTRTVRPPSDYTSRLKVEQMQQYGLRRSVQPTGNRGGRPITGPLRGPPVPAPQPVSTVPCRAAPSFGAGEVSAG